MNKMSELIGKPVIAVGDTEIVGTVSAVLFDEKLTAVKAVKIVSEDDRDPEYGFIPWGKLLDKAHDACVILDKSSVLFEWNSRAQAYGNPVNLPIYGQNGRHYGYLTDIALNDKSVIEIIAGEFRFPSSRVLSYSSALVILAEEGAQKKPARRRKKAVPKKADGVTVQIHALHQKPETNETVLSQSVFGKKVETTETAPGQIIPDKKPGTTEPALSPAVSGKRPGINKTAPGEKPLLSNESVSLPSRVPPENTVVSRTPQSPPAPDAPSFAFLLGKTLSRDLLSDDGKLFAKEASLVTEEVIRLAKLYGKLVQLALYAD